jgi:hypothetical protein
MELFQCALLIKIRLSEYKTIALLALFEIFIIANTSRLLSLIGNRLFYAINFASDYIASIALKRAIIK